MLNPKRRRKSRVCKPPLADGQFLPVEVAKIPTIFEATGEPGPDATVDAYNGDLVEFGPWFSNDRGAYAVLPVNQATVRVYMHHVVIARASRGRIVHTRSIGDDIGGEAYTPLAFAEVEVHVDMHHLIRASETRTPLYSCSVS